MQTNNRNTTIYGTTMDKVRRAKRNIQSAKKVQSNRYEATREDIKRTIEIIHGEKELVKESNHIVVNKNPWRKKSNQGNINEVTQKLSTPKMVNFFDVISGKVQDAKEFMGITLNNLESVTMANQISAANESLVSWENAISHFKNNVENQGKIFAWDLETTGGKDLNGIWRPDSITEFSMQEYDYATKNISKVNVLVGMTEDEGREIFSEIETAIKNGSIDSNERLRVSAMRYAKYGDEAFSKAKHSNGYWYATNFPTTDKDNWKDVDVIKRGIDHFVEAGRETDIIGGIRADQRAIATAINNANRNLASGNASLLGYNDLKHDKPILESMLMKWSKENPSINSLFDNGSVGLNATSDQWIDLFGGVKLFTDYNSITDLYAGADISKVSKIRGQEELIKNHLPKWFEEMGLRPHMAEDDVTALLGLATKSSEITPNGESFLDYITNGLNNVKTNKINVTPGQHVLRAKRGIMKSNDGKNYFNFAHSKSTGNIYLSDNHVIEAGQIFKEDFSAGFGVNKGHMYDILNIGKFTLDDEMRGMLGDISPEYSGKELYRLQLGMAVHDDYKNTRMNDLVQNIVFKNEKEMNSFLSGYFDVVAERDTNGNINIIEGMEKHFDRRRLVKKNGKAHFEELNKNATPSELFQAQVLANNEKLAVSRADNAMFKDNSYRKISKALNLKSELEETLQIKSLQGQDILAIMSERVSKGQMAMELNNEQIATAQNIISQALGYDKNNVTRLLDSSINNMAFGIDMISTHEKMLTNVVNSLNELEGFKDKSSDYKQQLFSRVLKEVKVRAAEQVYNNPNTQDMLMLGDKKLESTFAELKNIFEIDYGSLIKGNRINYIDMANPGEYADVLKLDLSDVNSTYKLIDNAVDIVYGKDHRKDGMYEVSSMTKMFDMLNGDKQLGRTEAFKKLRKDFGFNKGNFTENVHSYQLAEGIIAGMKELKNTNATNGLINIDHSFMKAIQGHTGFGAVLNSDGVINQIPDIVKNISDNFRFTELDSSDATRRLAEELVKKHYMPNYRDVQNSIGYNKTVDMLYKNAKNDLTNYMEDVLSSITRIDGASLSIQDNGELVVSRAGKVFNLNNIPRIGLDESSGVLDIELGSMKLQLGNELTFNQKGSSVEGGSRSTLGILNEYKVSRGVKYASENEGAEAALDALTYGINRGAKQIRQMPTINGFGGNDIDANNSVGLSGIKNVLVEMFGEGGSLNHLVDNAQFADKDLVKTLRNSDTIKYLVNSDKKMEELNPEIVRDISKNMEFLLNIIRDNDNISSDFDFLSRDLSFTGSEKRVSNLVAVKGYRPTNSTLGVFDNVQRPPITQSGNAFQLRVDDILEATKTKNMNIGVGNVISSANMDNRLMRQYSGIGKTTTDVMMNITYVDTNSLDVIFNSNFERVINGSDVDVNARKQTAKAYQFVKNSINTFEQERAIDSRIHEAVYGLRSAQTQKLSKNYDIVDVLDSLKGSDYEKQAAAILDYRGKFNIDGDNITYSASHGKLLKKGESAIKWKGFADIESSFASKVQDGVFNYNFYESDGTKVRVSEINKIIKANKESFKGKSTQAEMIRTLEDLLASKGIKGQYAIEDISAIGYVKTMTSGAEKGMTKVVYASTGSYDERVKKFFQGINAWDKVNSKVITDEATEAFYYKNKKLGAKALQAAGFNSLQDLKFAMEAERHMHSGLLFDKILDGSTHVLANDAVVKHANVGQMYQGTLSKAINSLTKKYDGDQSKAVGEIVSMINSNKDFQFLNNLDITNEYNLKNLTSIGIRNDNGIFRIDEDFKTGVNVVSSLNAERFSNLISAIDDKLEGLSPYDRLINKNTNGALFSNTREPLKYVKDAETQTGVTAEFFELKKTNRELQKRRIELEKQLNGAVSGSKEHATLNLQLLDVKNKLQDVNENISAYTGAVKTMKLGDQELSILERVSMTDAHAEKINELISSGEVSRDTFLNSVAFQGKVKIGQDGRLEFDNLGERALSGLTNQFKANQYYDRFSEDLLTAEMVNTSEYSHLKDMYDYATKHNRKLGVKSAEQQYQHKLADRASRFNRGKVVEEDLLNQFEVRNIRDLKFNAEDISTKNIIADLGESFGENRYIAVPGLGMKVADEEVRTVAQNKLLSLQHRIDDIAKLAGGDPDKEAELITKVLNTRVEAMSAIDKSIYGKNGAMHSSAKIEVDAVSYRLKASGIITGTTSDDMIEAARKAGIDLADSSVLTNKSMINGKTIASWENTGEAFFGYKYVSREQMANMGYFKDDTLKQYGFLVDGTSKEEAVSKMEEFLKTHGTYDITDRYPNTRNESVGATRVFLGDGLAGNQTKVSVATALGANADHDGDSYSSFRIELEGKSGKRYDGGLYELAKVRANEQGIKDVRQFAIDQGLMEGEVFDEFARIERGMISDATSFKGKHWNKEAMSKILKDFEKNIDLSNSEKMVLVPGGKSVLGQYAFAGITGMPTIQEFNNIEAGANEILNKAKSILESQGQDTSKFVTDITQGNSSKMLDEALGILKDNVSEEDMNRYNAIAIKRANIDRYSQEIMAKTGLAATGSVNLALNSVKLAAHFRENSTEDIAFTNYVWSVLDTAEQGVISSKKLEGTVYDDSRISEFKQAMKSIFTGKAETPSETAINGLGNWLDQYGDNVFETAYNTMGSTILSKEQLSELNGMEQAKRIQAGTKMMKDKFLSQIESLASDKIAMSYVSSFDAIGRNGGNVANMWGDKSIAIAAAKGDTLSSAQQGMMDYGDDAFLRAAIEAKEQAKLAKQQAAIAKESLGSRKAVQEAVESYATSNVAKSGPGGLGMMALGVAAGLMVGGYAAGNPLNDKSAQQVSEEQTQPQQTMSIPDFMEKESGYVTGNSQQGYIINIRADTKKGRKHMQKVMSKAAEATVGGAVSVNMNIKNVSQRGITDSDIENYINRFF